MIMHCDQTGFGRRQLWPILWHTYHHLLGRTEWTHVKLPYHHIQYLNTCQDMLVWTRSALFWDIMRCHVVIVYQYFGTMYQSHLQGSWTSWPLKMGPIRCPETLVNNYHMTPYNIPEERRCQQHCGRSLKSRLVWTSLIV
jgi:hypothetical protein